jgi:hypothetical protein
MLERAARNPLDDGKYFSVRAILSAPDELLDLSETRRSRARADTMRRFEAGALATRDDQPPQGPDGISARAVRDPRRGLLILYAIDPADPRLDNDLPLLGLAVSFPKTSVDRSITYQVNNVYWQMELGLT